MNDDLRRRAERHDRQRRLAPWVGGALFFALFAWLFVPRKPSPMDFRRRIDGETTLIARSYPMVSKTLTLNIADFTIETARGPFWAGSAFGPYDPAGRPVRVEATQMDHRIRVVLPPGFTPKSREVDAGPWRVEYSVQP